MRLRATSCSCLLSWSQLAIREVVPSGFITIGPRWSSLMGSLPTRRLGKLSSPAAGRRGTGTDDCSAAPPAASTYTSEHRQ